MATVAPLGRDRAIALVKEGSFPIAVGSPVRTVMIAQQDGKYRIREVVVDRAAAEEAVANARRPRSPSWMPEHYYSLGSLTGEVFIEAPSAEELIEKMTTMEWPAHW